MQFEVETTTIMIDQAGLSENEKLDDPTALVHKIDWLIAGFIARQANKAG